MKLFSLPAAASPSFRGILILKLLFALASVALIVSAISGVASVSTSARGVVITYHTVASRLLTVALAPFYLALCYGLHRRLLVTWRAGLVLLALSYATFAWSVCAAGRAEPSLLPLVFSLFGLLGGAAVTAYWWLWWRRQRAYFAAASHVT